jgi:hypothetical protein
MSNDDYIRGIRDAYIMGPTRALLLLHLLEMEKLNEQNTKSNTCVPTNPDEKL